jgi:SOS response regulatory protein OraA/RecX
MSWPTFRTKLSAFLARRGFGYDIVAEVCRETWENLNGKVSSNL